MPLTRLSIHDFRNIAAADLCLTEGVNVLVGANGSGKTSVLEAIYTLGHGRSFHSSQLVRAIRDQQAQFVLHGKVITAQRQSSIGLSKGRDGESRIRIDGHDGQKIAELAHLLPIQLITPEGFKLLNGGPKYRRAFLDWGCFHQDVHFFNHWNHLRRVLKQRNAALRQVTYYQQIRHWDEALANLAQQVTKLRAAYAQRLLEDIQQCCRQFLPECDLQFVFQPGWDQDRDYADVLERQFARDKTVAYTSMGPHKADLQIRIKGIPVEEGLSRGQLKLLMCAMKLAQGQRLTQQRQQACLYLIDDFASELDAERRALLAMRLKSMGAQVVVSALSVDQLDDMMMEKSSLFAVKQGAIVLQSQH